MALIKFPGGKGKCAKNIVALLSGHEAYVEPFGGAASVLFAKSPSNVEIYNDIDGELVNLFRVIQRPDTFQQLERRLSATPYSRQEFEEATFNGSPVDRAWSFYVRARQSFAGRMAWWATSKSAGLLSPRRGAATNYWMDRVDGLRKFHERLRLVAIEHVDFRDCLCRYERPETLFYCDPPYLGTTSDYRFKMSNADHVDLLNLAIQLCSKVLISASRSELYDDMLRDWKRVDFQVPRSFSMESRAGFRTESVYINPRGRRE